MMKTIQELSIRKSAKSKIYRSALRFHPCLCLGFILGNRSQQGGTILEFPLDALKYHDGNDLSVTTAIDCLNNYLTPAKVTAKVFARRLIGVFGAWDHTKPVNAMRLGALVDYAVKIKVQYVLLAPTDGGESIWGIQVYDSTRFPSGPLEYKTSRKRSTEMNDNPKRVQSMWRKSLADSQIINGQPE